MGKKYSLDQARDTGLALVLVLLIVGIIKQENLRILIPVLWGAAGVLFVCMAAPILFKPMAPIWFGFSRFLGSIMSNLFFSLIYITLAIPIGLSRKVIGKDPMRLKPWKMGKESVFIHRNHTYTCDDLKRPF